MYIPNSNNFFDCFFQKKYEECLKGSIKAHNKNEYIIGMGGVLLVLDVILD